MRIAVKICGITREEDVIAAAEAGADHIGFVCYPPSKRFVSLLRLTELARSETRLKRVGVFVNPDWPALETAVCLGRLDVVQLHGEEPPEMAAAITCAEVWKAVRLASRRDVAHYAGYPAAKLLVDSAEGGSGRCCDWSLAAELARIRPIVLAGGITPENACEAVRRVRPWGIDLSSGVESAPGIKDLAKIHALFNNLKGQL